MIALFLFLRRGAGEALPAGIPWWIFLMIMTHMVTGLLIVWLIVEHLFSLAKDPGISPAAKFFWGTVLCASGACTLPLYWYALIWRAPKKKER